LENQEGNRLPNSMVEDEEVEVEDDERIVYNEAR
jgi:hypothetical protein